MKKQNYLQQFILSRRILCKSNFKRSSSLTTALFILYSILGQSSEVFGQAAG